MNFRVPEALGPIVRQAEETGPMRRVSSKMPDTEIVKSKSRKKGELLFERYLRESGHSGWREHEPDLGINTRPDYRISKNGASAVAEVKEFDDGKLHRRLVESNRNQGFFVGDREVFGDVRNKIRAAARQLKPLEGSGIPLVVVLTNPKNIWLPLDDTDVPAAMYGMPTVGGDYDAERGEIVNMRLVPGRNGKLYGSHLYISAVARPPGIRRWLRRATDIRSTSDDETFVFRLPVLASIHRHNIAEGAADQRLQKFQGESLKKSAKKLIGSADRQRGHRCFG